LRNWFHYLDEREVRVRLRAIPIEIESFMQRMNVFAGMRNLEYVDRTSGNKRQSRNIVEVCVVEDLRQIDMVAERLAATIVRSIPDIQIIADPSGMKVPESEHTADIIGYVFSEMLLNALDHGRKRGYRNARATVAAAYYPTRQAIAVAIVDDGCGLLETLRAHPQMEGEETHARAIQIALLPRVSCNRDAALGLDSRNQGIGLTVSTALALRTGGRFGIFSGDGWRVGRGNGQLAFPVVPWQGTGVYLEFQRRNIDDASKADVIRHLPGYRTVNEIRFG